MSSASTQPVALACWEAQKSRMLSSSSHGLLSIHLYFCIQTHVEAVVALLLEGLW